MQQAAEEDDAASAKTIEPRKETLPIIAYKGGFELLAASWDLNNGRTVKFRLMEEPGHAIMMHPFAAFTRRRGGKVGTRFQMVITMNGSEEPMFNGEVMLMSGGQPLGQGYWVSFWLDDEASHHPFAGYRGRRGDTPGEMFSAAFVEFDDDDVPIDQKKRGRLEDAHARHEQKLSNWAAMRCQDPMFLQYLSERALVNGNAYTADWWGKENHAARWIRWRCGIESRAELDNNVKAATLFHEQIREPYADWRNVNE